MGGIGDYIHYKYDNYKQYGLNTVRRRDRDSHKIDPKNVLSTVHTQIFEKFKKYGNWNQANKLSEQLNYFYGGTGDKQISSEHLDKKVRDAVQIAIETYLSDYESRGLVLDIAHLNFDYKPGHASIKRGVSDLYSGLNKEGKVGEKAQIEGLIKKVDLFIKQSSDITSKDGLNNNDFRALERLRTNWEGVRRQLKQMLEEQRTYVNSDMAITGTSGNAYTSYGNFLQEYNSLLDKFRLGKAVYNGLLGEFVIPAILYAVENKGAKTLDGLMKEFANNYKSNKKGDLGGRGQYANTGTRSSKKVLRQDNFGVRIDTYIDLPEGSEGKENNQFNYTQNYDGNLVSVRATPDKVDVEISYDDLEYNINMKNYKTKLSRKVQLHSGKLLYLIQTESDFINHYLNIASERVGGKHKQAKQAPNSVQAQAVQIMNELVLSKSLTGGVASLNGTTKMNDYFVMNDSSNGRFYVIPMSAIIDQGKSAEGNQYIKITYNGNSNKLLIKNKWQTNPKTDGGGYNSMQKAYVRLRLMVQELAMVHVETRYDLQQIMKLREK